MIADISTISDIRLRDKCLKEIDDCVTYISTHIIHKSELMDDDTTNDLISKVNKRVAVMVDSISELLEEAGDIDEEDDDDVDEDVETVSPKKLILKGVDCPDKIFKLDPDIGFEVIEGSDPENNDYCIYAQNDANLYNFLRDSIRDQLSTHYSVKLNKDAFDDMIEDLLITVSFSFINETDAVITEVASVIQFNNFKDRKNNTYVTKERYDHDNHVHSCTCGHDSVDTNDHDQSVNETETQEEENYEEVSMVSMPQDEILTFLVDKVGANRDSMKHFINTLTILQKANPEAYESISDAFVDIMEDIEETDRNGKLTDEKKMEVRAQIKTIVRNMKKHYGADINLYLQTH
jgi:hypothetical protein